eukprot:Gregarina_sp_Poly_1__4517@NODE_2425_length_2150_cov_229_221315_g1541_i0_p1_GENE_NODE_2425_length_2150_cov_229_221315_g1541_i0NODE_2425_length_2150_cov_229_221315_g1541_i0_p1_ORF_typecomplete_len333_score27_49MFS_1/PF07690_16/0_00025MFS_1/PF07690_16/2_5e03_NODE_2425_length_2150_cov_229_221315_g1541_i05121510
MLAYAPELQRGFYVGLFWAVFNVGGVFATITSLGGLTSGTDTGQNGLYWFLVSVMFLASFLLPRLILHPEQVKAASGVEIQFIESDGSAEGVYDEAANMLKVCFIPEMILMSLLFVGSLWDQSYHNNFITYYLTTDRAAMILQIVHWTTQVVGPFTYALVLDCALWNLRKRCLVSFLILVGVWVLTWVLAVVFQYGFEGGYDKDRPPQEKIDWWDVEHRMLLPGMLAALFGFADCVTQMYIYWFLGVLAQNDVVRAARYIGYYKGLQCLGNAVSWGLDFMGKNSYRFQLWLCIAHFLIDLPLTFIAALNIHLLDSRMAQETGKTPTLHIPLI